MRSATAVAVVVALLAVPAYAQERPSLQPAPEQLRARILTRITQVRVQFEG